MRLLDRRIGRAGFALGYFPVLVVVFALVTNADEQHWHPTSGDVADHLFLVAIFIWSLCITAWRCHDYGQSLWSNFWTEQAPFIGPVVGLWDLISKPGTVGLNPYGPAPRL